MKRAIQTLTAFAIIIWTATTIHASSIGAYYGIMDTDLFGSGDVAGGILEMDFLPFTSVQIRGGYADSFGKVSLQKIKLDGLPDDTRYIAETLLDNLDRSNQLELDDFCIIPLEVGVVGRISMLGFIGIYAGAGGGYYIIPSFNVTSKSGFSLSESLDNPFGYWFLAGAEAGLPIFSLFAEVKYTQILKDDLEINVEYAGQKGTLTADINLSGMMFLVGTRLKW